MTRRPQGAARGAVGAKGAKTGPAATTAAEAGPLAVDLAVLAGFFGAGPAWSDNAAGRHRFRIDAPAGGWLEFYVAPAERLVSLRVADGAVHAIHVDLTLDAVEAIVVGRRGDQESWLEVTCGRGPGETPCGVSVTLRPDILVVLGYGRR